MKITLKAYGKINLLLDILSTLENGYHELFMLMQSVSLADEVTVEEREKGEIEILCDRKDIPCDENNLAHKAAREFFAFTKKENRGIAITLKKNIPHSAGLAGGSADAAAVIRALDILYGTELYESQLIDIGKRVGADVPFCIFGGTMLAQYTGTVLSRLPDAQIPAIVIVKPSQSVSTAEAYALFDKAYRVRHLDKRGALIAAAEGDLKGITDRAGNVFEQFIEVTDRAYIKAEMRKQGAMCSLMTGSGPCVFGVFDSAEKAEKCADELKKTYGEVYLCSAVARGLELIS